MVSVLADKWTVSISPVCRSPGWRAEVRTRALTQKAHERARTYRPEMRVNECLHARFVSAHAWTRTHAAVSSHFHPSGDRRGASERGSRCSAPAGVSVVRLMSHASALLRHFVVASGAFTPSFVASTRRSDWRPEQEAEHAQQQVNWKKIVLRWQITMETFSQVSTFAVDNRIYDD